MTLDYVVASDEEVDALRKESLRTLDEAGRDLQKLAERERKDKVHIGLTGLEMGKVLCEVLDRPMSEWDVPPSKLPDGQMQRLASWAKRTAGLSYPHVAKLTRAHRVVDAIYLPFSTGKNGAMLPHPLNEGQLRPLARLVNSHREEIPAIWELACSRAKREGNPSASEVRRVAKEEIPEAFKQDRKGKTQLLKSVRALRSQAKDKAAYRAALEAALEEIR